MDTVLAELLAELERFGQQNDEAKTARGERMLNITRDTGEFLSVLVRATGARRILEVGTSNGYSSLWLAEAVAPLDGAVDTLERSPMKQELALANFARAGLAGRIRSHLGDAADWLKRGGDGAHDFIFLDSHRPDYLSWWPDLRRLLAPGGVLVVDNATSHPRDMAEFTAAVAADSAFTTALVPVGKGEFVAHKARG
jgi:predicted O-methyltransferase YrrM